MKVYLHVICLAAAVAALALPMTRLQAQEQEQAQAQAQASKGDADNGHKLFDSVGCYQCHGYVGQGGSAGPGLAKTKLPFDAFLMQVRKPSNQMPPYEAVVLPDQSAADIYAYIQSLPAPVDMSTVNLPH